MSDIIREVLMEDAARINVPQMTWKQVKQSHRRVRGKADWKRRLLVYEASAAVLLIMAIGVSGFVSPVMAKVLQKIPIIGELYSFTYIPKLNQYALDANPSVTDKGITVSAPKAYYDGYQIRLIYAIQVPEGYEPVNYAIQAPEGYQQVDVAQINLTTTKILLNGKQLPIESATGGESLVSPNMYRGDIVWYLASDQMSRSGMLTIPIHQVGTIKGNWTLSVPVSSEAVDNAIKTMFPKDASKTYDGITITVNKVCKGPVYTTISMQIRQPLQMNSRFPFYMPLNGMALIILTPSRQDLAGEFIGSLPPSKKIGNEEVWDDLTMQCITPSDDIKSIIVEPVLLGLEESKNIRQLDVTVPLNEYP